MQDHVLSVDISLEKKTAFVTYNEFGITATKIISIIEDCGFDAKEQFKIMFRNFFMSLSGFGQSRVTMVC